MDAKRLLETVHCICRDRERECYECPLAYINKYNIYQCCFQLTIPSQLLTRSNEIIRTCEHYRVENNMDK